MLGITMSKAHSCITYAYASHTCACDASLLVLSAGLLSTLRCDTESSFSWILQAATDMDQDIDAAVPEQAMAETGVSAEAHGDAGGMIDMETEGPTAAS